MTGISAAQKLFRVKSFHQWYWFSTILKIIYDFKWKRAKFEALSWEFVMLKKSIIFHIGRWTHRSYFEIPLIIFFYLPLCGHKFVFLFWFWLFIDFVQYICSVINHIWCQCQCSFWSNACCLKINFDQIGGNKQEQI